MKEVQMFKAAKQTNRFNKNQKVWIRQRHPNHLDVYFKYRGSGRYVSGVLDRFAPCVSELKTFEVDDEFASKICGKY